MYTTKFIKKTKIADGTWQYIFERPQGFDYVPGQHIVVKLDVNVQRPKENLRSFTLSSSPTEDCLHFTFRENDSLFKKKLRTFHEGDSIAFFGPAGNFVLQKNNNHPLVMIAGGIGIVPFRVFMKYAYDKQLSYNFTLFYSNPTVERITFKEELDQFRKKGRCKIKTIYALTEQVPKHWKGERGRISVSMINKYTHHLENPSYYICGPEQMVDDIKKVIQKELTIDKKYIFTEKFTGY